MIRDAEHVLGVPIDRKPLEQAVAEVLAAVDLRGPRVVFACANPHSVVTSQKDGEFRKALQGATFVAPDGIGIALLARLGWLKVGPRITGSDYFRAVMNALDHRSKGRVFFFGSTPQVLDRIVHRTAREFPRLTVCGALSPPFRPWSPAENKRMVETINQAQPDVLWVGMTAPKQEKWVARNIRMLNAPVIGSIGAVFDFFAGTVPRAPDRVCRLGFEWAYRLAREPGRLWKRNLLSTPKFIALVLRHHVLRERHRFPFRSTRT